MSSISRIIFIKKELIKMFNDFNSWIIPIYYKNNRVSKFDFDYVIFNYYCHGCRTHTKKKLKFYENIKQAEFYICEECENENFLHIDLYKNKSLKINYQFIFNDTKNNYEIAYYLDTPFLKYDEIINKKLTINTISINKRTFQIQVKKNSTKEYENICKLKDLLAENILKNIKFNDLELETIFLKYHFFKKNKLQIIINFLRNKHLKDIELCFTTNDFNKKTIKEYIEYIANFQKSKSLLKSLYQGFMKDIDKNIYNYKSDFIIIRSFKDINFISNLIKNRNSYKHILNDEYISIKDFIDFIIWLQKFYTQKQVASLFLKRNMDSLFSDLFKMGIDLNKNQKEYLMNNFHKESCNIKSIHDELVRLYNLNRNLYKPYFFKGFSYTDEDYKFEMEINDLEIRLPKNIKELSTWGYLLKNCMASYSFDVEENKTRIYGIFRNDEILYALEKREKSIVQFLGKFNKQVTYEDRIAVLKEFKNIIKES